MTPHRHRAYSPPVMTVSQHTGAFVIRFETGTDTNIDQFEGRVEHVASCQSTHFRTWDQLTAFLERVLIEARAEEYRLNQISLGNSHSTHQFSQGEKDTKS